MKFFKPLNKNPPFDIQKTFFRRPFLNKGDKLFYNIFLFSSITILSLVFSGIHYFGKMTDQQIFKDIKKIYIAQFLQNMNTEKNAAIISIHDAEENKTFSANNKSREDLFFSDSPSPENLNLEIFRPARPDSEFNQALESVINNKTQHFQEINSIVENIAPLASAKVTTEKASPLSPILRRRNAAERNLRVFKAPPQNSEITIKPPEITDFQVVKGYRKYQQTLSISSENKEFIRYCVEKFKSRLEDFRGNIVVRFEIHPDGYVIPESVKIIKTDIKDPRILQCIKKNIRRWRNFPKVAYEMGNYTITQKYIF